MTKIRTIFITLTILVVGITGLIASFYARGYRFNLGTFKFEPKGILVVKTDPTGSEIYINSNFKTTSDANISLAPGTYDVSIKKEGFIPWNKRLIIEKEIVTEVFVPLFKAVPSLSPVTFDGVYNPTPSGDYTKLAYYVAPLENQPREKSGLWVIENLNLPIGFTKDPRRITNGNFLNASWEFSPDGNEILLKNGPGIFLLNAVSFTPQNKRVNITSRYNKILADWEKERDKKTQSKLKPLPEELEEVFTEKTEIIEFSPDYTKFIYIASGSAYLKESLVKELPGSSTQKQERNIKKGQIYIYDIKEDRNFLIENSSERTIVGHYKPENANKRVAWFPNSNNLVLAEKGRITIMDYDGTNRQVVYSGEFTTPLAFPFASTSKLIILTNLGADSSTPNLYSLTIQ